MTQKKTLLILSAGLLILLALNSINNLKNRFAEESDSSGRMQKDIIPDEKAVSDYESKLFSVFFSENKDIPGMTENIFNGFADIKNVMYNGNRVRIELETRNINDDDGVSGKEKDWWKQIMNEHGHINLSVNKYVFLDINSKTVAVNELSVPENIKLQPGVSLFLELDPSDEITDTPDKETVYKLELHIRENLTENTHDNIIHYEKQRKIAEITQKRIP